MGKISRWRYVSRQQLGEIIAANPRNSGESKEEYGRRLKAAITAGYPFKYRSGHAYQCWLDERKTVLAYLGLYPPPWKQPAPPQVAPAPDPDPSRIQLPLPLDGLHPKEEG